MLVNGAAGGVGLAAVQIAKALGATVVASVSSEEKAKLAKANGADHVVRTDVPDLHGSFRKQVFDAVGKRGVDIIVDPVGGDVFDASFATIAWSGRVVVVGFAEGRIPQVKAGYPAREEHLAHRPAVERLPRSRAGEGARGAAGAFPPVRSGQAEAARHGRVSDRGAPARRSRSFATAKWSARSCC